MRKIGIIAEFNPLHNGHKYLIDYAKKHFENAPVIIAMSGNFTQSGEPAIADKYVRAKMATDNGADLVIEMPVCGATSSAEGFATCGVSLLAKAGVDILLFACEDPDAGLFMACAGLLANEPAEYKSTLQTALKEGLSYPMARAKALCSVSASDATALSAYDQSTISDFLAMPNNILGIEYAKAIIENGYDITVCPVLRIGSAHNEDNPYTASSEADTASKDSSDTSVQQGDNTIYPTGDIVSAGKIRKLILASNVDGRKAIFSGIYGSLFTVMPNVAADLLSDALKAGEYVLPFDFDLLLHQSLITNTDFDHYYDCTFDLSNKIKKEKDNYRSFSSFADILKSKDITRSRIMRVLCHILLGITDEDADLLKASGYAPYLHILSASPAGMSLFSDIKSSCGVPLFMSVNELKEGGSFKSDIGPEARRLLEIDIYSSDLYRAALTARCGHTLPTEFTRKISF